MTAEPAAPGAAAIYLLRDERADDKLHVHITYVRLKVLTEKGKEYADQEISYEGAQFKIFGVEGRTIHSDGTVIPFSGKPYQKVLEKAGKEKYKATVFTLPDVQVGSILEYRYVLELRKQRGRLAPLVFTRSSLRTQSALSIRSQRPHSGRWPRRRDAGPASPMPPFFPRAQSVVYSPAGQVLHPRR